MIRLLLFAFALASAAVAQTPGSADLTAAQSLEHGKQFDQAADAYRAALKHDPACLPCLESLVRVSMAMDDYKGAASYAHKLAAAATEPAARAHGFSLEAQADYRAYFAAQDPDVESDEVKSKKKKDPKPTAELLRGAEAAAAAGLAADPSDEHLRMLRGHILAAQKRDAEAASEFNACAASTTLGPVECARALRLSKDLDSARSEPAPAFTLKARDGSSVSLDKLAGKVVLIDFWGTWCVYCRNDADYVQSMIDTFPKETFALLEIDEKDDRPTWRDYLRDNSLDGIQTYDASGSVADRFHVTGYPTYVILDANGNMRHRYSGAKGDLKGDVKSLLAALPQ